MADTPKPPPNLRVSTDEGKECDDCSHYERGRCALYNSLPVDGEWVCDSWAKGTETDDDEDDSPPAKNLQQAERVAYVRVRAHNRRAKQASKANSGEPDADDRVK